jgi:hypothetical protein
MRVSRAMPIARAIGIAGTWVAHEAKQAHAVARLARGSGSGPRAAASSASYGMWPWHRSFARVPRQQRALARATTCKDGGTSERRLVRETPASPLGRCRAERPERWLRNRSSRRRRVRAVGEALAQRSVDREPHSAKRGLHFARLSGFVYLELASRRDQRDLLADALDDDVWSLVAAACSRAQALAAVGELAPRGAPRLRSSTPMSPGRFLLFGAYAPREIGPRLHPSTRSSNRDLVAIRFVARISGG